MKAKGPGRHNGQTIRGPGSVDTTITHQQRNDVPSQHEARVMCLARQPPMHQIPADLSTYARSIRPTQQTSEPRESRPRRPRPGGLSTPRTALLRTTPPRCGGSHLPGTPTLRESPPTRKNGDRHGAQREGGDRETRWVGTPEAFRPPPPSYAGAWGLPRQVIATGPPW